MKNIYLILFSFTIGSLFAQDNITIQLEGSSVDYSGASYSMSAPSQQMFDVSFEIHNNGNTPYDWYITRRKLNVPSGWSDGLCWGLSNDPFGGTCFSSGQMGSVLWTNSSNTTFTVGSGDYAKLKAQIDPDDATSGIGTYRYYVGTDATGINNMDSVDLIVDYAASINEETVPFTISINPNPASQYIHVVLSNSETATLKIYDVLGQQIKKTSVSGSKKINVSNFKNGIYFISIKSPNRKAVSRKVVIRH